MKLVKLIALLAAMGLGAGTARATDVIPPGDTSGNPILISGLPYNSGTVSTCGMNNDFTNGSGDPGSPCPDLPGPYAGPDTFYQITLGAGDHVTFSLTMSGSTGDLALFLVSADMNTCAANSVDVIGFANEEITFPYTYPPGTYYLIVDSVAGGCGSYTLSVTGSLACGNGVVEEGEICDGGACCSADCKSFKNASTECRASAGVCDEAEFCTGASAACPVDSFQDSSTECRASAGVCDVAENCTGSSAACPADSFDSSSLCRPSVGVCDVPEFCAGSGPDCPADGFDSSTMCRPSAGVCDVPEFCAGSGPDCPADSFDSGSVCRPSAGVCDVAESCTGSGPDCPPDGFDSVTVCRPSAGVCDVAESCTGAGPGCPPDTFQTGGTTCQDATKCQAAGTCQGTASCVPGAPVNCDDGNPYTADSCDESTGCVHTLIPDSGVPPSDSGTDAGVVDAVGTDAGDSGATGGSGGSGGDAASGTGHDAAGGSSGAGGAGGPGGAGGAAGAGGAGGGIVPPPWWATGGNSGSTGSGGTGGTSSHGPDAHAPDAAGGGSAGAGGATGGGGNGGGSGTPGTGGTQDAAGMDGTPNDGTTDGVGGISDDGGSGLASQDASPLSDAARADGLRGGDAKGGDGLLPEAGSQDGLTYLGDGLASDAHGGTSGDATAPDGKVVEPAAASGSGCKCDTGRSSNRPGNFAGAALLLGALVLRSLRRRRSLGKTLLRFGRRETHGRAGARGR